PSDHCDPAAPGGPPLPLHDALPICKLDKLVEKVGAVVKCEPLEPAKAAGWAATRCKKRHGVDIEPRAARMLVDRLGSGLGRIDTEMAKLASEVGPGGTITVEVVEQTTGVSRWAARRAIPRCRGCMRAWIWPGRATRCVRAGGRRCGRRAGPRRSDPRRGGCLRRGRRICSPRLWRPTAR